MKTHQRISTLLIRKLRDVQIVAGVLLMAGVSNLSVSGADPGVEASGGNIMLRLKNGEAKQLTNSGRDSGPVLSPDGRWVVFVRAVPGKEISTGSGDVPAAELWQISASGKDPTRLVAPRAAEDMKNVIATFENVQFSSDGRLVYFVTPAYATSGAVHVVDTTNGKEHFVMSGNGLEVIPKGEYRDCLLVQQHRYFLGGGSFDWFWLFRPDGKDIGPVGEDTANFNELYVSDAKKPEGGGKAK
jgi:hypothetical protein